MFECIKKKFKTKEKAPEKLKEIPNPPAANVPEIKPPTDIVAREKPAHFVIAESMIGSKETDPAFNNKMSKNWSLFGMNLGTIKESWAAWCGLFVAVCLAGSGTYYIKDGALAKNWDKYPYTINWKVDGIPQGAIVRINHNFNCNSEKGNHVAFANTDCAAKDLVEMKKDSKGVYQPVLKPVSIPLLGGNQNNQVKVSYYSVKEICSVHWTDDKAPKITESIKCISSNSNNNESTR